MEVRFLKPEEAEVLEKFVAGHPHGSIEQTWDWGVLQTTIPGREAMFALGAFEGKRLVASMLLIRQEMGMKKNWLWCPRGPLLPAKGAKEAWGVMKDACRDLAKQSGAVFLRMEPGVEAAEPLLAKGKTGGQSYLPENTLVLDLAVSEETILGQMTQKGRYNIRQAAKTGVYVRKAPPNEIDDFYDILKETAGRDGFFLHDRDFYERFLELLEGKAHFYLAHHDHDLLGGMMVTHFGDTATYYFGASSGEFRQKMAPYALQWFAIQDAKKAGLKRYDLLGVAPEGDTKHVLAGVTQFKTRFGGKRVDYHGPQVVVFRPTWWLLYRIAKYVARLHP